VREHTELIVPASTTAQASIARPDKPSPAVSFLTHYNYLAGIDLLLRADYGGGIAANHDTVLGGIAERTNAFLDERHIRVRSDSARSIHILGMAWATEAALNIDMAPEIAPVANNWAVVQAYYACYQAFQAFLVAGGQSEIDSHARASRQFTSLWVKRGCDLPPWSLGHANDGRVNFPDRATFPDAKSIDAPNEQTYWTHASRCLRKTRDGWLEDTRKEALELRRKTHGDDARLPTAQLAEIKAKARPANILDYLYRLRHRSNYEDARMFVDGPRELEQSVRLNVRLRELVSATMLAHELRIIRSIGPAPFLKAAQAWSRRLGSQGPLGIQARLAYIAN
jgi:hypothetical protein